MYTSTSLTEQLGIPISTFRRWCKGLEEAGYHFERQQNRRLFFEKDLKLLKVLQLAMMIPGMTLEDACDRLLLLESTGKRATNPDVVDTQEAEEARVQFEQKLAQLPERVYWLGAEQAIKELQVSYTAYKERVNEKGA